MPVASRNLEIAAPLPASGEWRSLHAELTRYVARSLSWDDASDIAQEALLKLVQHQGELVDAQHAQAWLYRVSRNAMLDELRRKRGFGAVELRSVAARDVAASNVAAPDSDEALIADVLNHVVGSWLRQQVTQLPEPYRQALIRVDSDGISQAELAAELGLSASGARTRVQRGRKLLAERLQACCAVEFDSRGNVLECEPKAPCGNEGGCGR
jgi:RNA polymerase sigma-70 factor (ECF subfamily)